MPTTLDADRRLRNNDNYVHGRSRSIFYDVHVDASLTIYVFKVIA